MKKPEKASVTNAKDEGIRRMPVNRWNEDESVRLLNEPNTEKNNWKELENMDKQKVLNELRSAKDVYVLVSRCTRMPYVVCDPETFDDEILIYFHEEDVKKEGARMIEEKNPIQIVRVEENQRLRFYANLYTMGVNSILVDKGLVSEMLIQLTELVTRPDPSKLPKGQILVENPGLHLTALYFMQEVRKQKLEKLTDELKEMQEEILADYSRGKFLVPFQDGNGVPLLKQPNGDTYQPIFTDAIEFGKFNRENKFKGAIVEATKIPAVLVKEARGVAVNPMGVNLQLPITKRPAQPGQGAPAGANPGAGTNGAAPSVKDNGAAGTDSAAGSAGGNSQGAAENEADR